MPKLPSVLGGAFDAANLYEVADEMGMRQPARIANGIHGLPDGSAVVLRIDDPPGGRR